MKGGQEPREPATETPLGKRWVQVKGRAPIPQKRPVSLFLKSVNWLAACPRARGLRRAWGLAGAGVWVVGSRQPLGGPHVLALGIGDELDELENEVTDSRAKHQELLRGAAPGISDWGASV